MSISSTGIYGSSYLSEDVEQLKIDVTSLTGSHLSVATEHDGRLDILETDNTSNKINISSNTTRIVELEVSDASNKDRLVNLEIDNGSNKDRLGDLEVSNTSHIERLVDLEDHDLNHALRLTDLEGQIFDVVHEPNIHEDDFFYFTPYPVPYAILEAYSQLIHSKSLTLKDRFDESETNDIIEVIKVIQEILQDHEMKIVAIEFFNSLSEAKAAAKFLWAGSKVVANKFGKKIITKLFPNWAGLLKLDYTELTDITDKTLNEVIDELDNLNTIFKYQNSLVNDKAGIKCVDLYLTPSINNIHIGSTITETVNDITFSDGTTGKTLNKYLDIKDNHPITRETDKITLNYDTTQFQTGVSPNYNLELKNIMGKVDIKDNSPIQKLTDKLYLNYDIKEFKTSAAASGYQLELNDIMDKVKIKTSGGISKGADGLYQTYEITTIDSQTLEKSTANELAVKLKTSGGISKGADGIYQTYEITTIDNQTLEKSTANELAVKLKTSGGISKGADGLYQTYEIVGLDDETLERTQTKYLTVKFSGTTSGFKANATGLQIKLPVISGLKITANGLQIDTATTGNLTLGADGIGISTTYKTELNAIKNSAELAKDAAVVARNAAQASQSACTTSQTAASGSATTATGSAEAAAASASAASGSATTAAGSVTAAAAEVTLATTQAGIATTQAGIATAAAGTATAAAGSAGTSALAAAGSALAAGGAVLLGLSGKADSTHYHSQYLEKTVFDEYKLSGVSNGKGWTGATYAAGTGIVTFASNDGFGFTTGDLRGGAGANGKGWTGATYAAGTGIVTFASNDAGYAFSTGDLRGGAGANGKGWTGATYNATTGAVTFASNDVGYALTTGDLRGAKGLGFKTGSSYNSATGVVSFLSDDGLAFSTGDLRGAGGPQGPQGPQGIQGIKGDTGASGATLTTTQLSALMNTTDHFTLNGTTNKIDFKQGLLDAKQATINSTAGQLIIGNGNGATTTNAGLTWTGGNMLNATNLTTTSGVYPNFIDCSSTIRGEELQVYGYALVVVGNSSTLMRICNNINNELRVQQTLVAANDVKFSIFQKDNSVEYATPTITFYKGKLGIGTTTPATYPLTVGGDINITGNYRINGALLDYFTLNNKPIILQPSTTNLQLVSGYTLSVPSNLAVGTTAVATNILQVGAGGRLRISNGTTDYTLLGTLDTDGSTNTSIVISGNTRSTNAGNIQYLATASAGSHIFYTASATTRMTISSSGVNVNNDLGVSGNVGVGVAPATYKLNVAGDINCTGAFRINGTALSTGSRWSLGADTTEIFYNTGNVGIGTNNPATILEVVNSSPIITIRDTGNANGKIYFGNSGHGVGRNPNISTLTGGNDVALWTAGDGSVGFITNSLERMRIKSDGNVGIGTNNPTYRTHLKCGYDNVSTGLHLDASDSSQYTLTIWPYVQDGGAVGWRFRTISLVGGTNTPLQFYHNGNVLMPGNLNVGSINTGGYVSAASYLQGAGAGGAFKIVRPDNWVRLRDSGETTHLDFAAGQLYAHSDITGVFTSVSNSGNDYLCIQQNAGSIGQGLQGPIKSAFGSFTAFHRCYTDDVLYNNESDESIDLFKNDYMGRVVIATGKIKTDFSRFVEPTEPPPESDIPTNPDSEWYSGIDKDGIAVEDAIPVVALSRKKKDKRVFGVLGMPNRRTNNKNRLIVNSIGEGGICVANTNGNIENGDYLQSSDLLGYGEKQDDDLLHNYTIAKATIDCNFELDSPYYQCHEIENGVRVAFIACSYHCG